ncbi:MAG: hypothetical protein ACREL2_05730 [Gemmatimonadales bacterium]
MPAPPPPASRQYRAVMWLMVLLAVAALVPAVQGARGIIPRGLGAASGALSIAGLILAAIFGLKGQRLAAAARERETARIALVILAGMLKDTTDEKLELLARQDDSGGQAARMILARRRQDQGPIVRRPPSTS